MTKSKPDNEPTPEKDYDGYETAAERATRLQAEAEAAVAAATEATKVARAERAKTQPPPDRAALLAICEQAFVPHENWSNRDSSAAVRQLGEAHSLLRAECPIVTIELDERGACWWVTFAFRGFDWFEGTGDAQSDQGPERDALLSTERYYLPTAERLLAAGGRDWY